MRLCFKLLVIDDQPDEIGESIELLKLALADSGFELAVKIAEDLSVAGIDAICAAEGRNIDLAIVDYRLGEKDLDGALAAHTIRRRLKFTDIVFYSSSPKAELAKQLAERAIDGVFLSVRADLDEALWGVAETIIGKAVDLNHMRGIAMAEVADLDVQMEELLEQALSSPNAAMIAKGKERIAKLLENEGLRVQSLEKLAGTSAPVDLVTNSTIFGSTYKWRAVLSLANILPNKPKDALVTFELFDKEILENRNMLAHARSISDDGTVASLKSIRRGQQPITIDNAWMIDFRTKLLSQKNALSTICTAVTEHLSR